MRLSIGAFAGGAADGYRKQQEEFRKQKDEARRQKEADRQDKEAEREAAYQNERAGIKDPQALYDEQYASWEKSSREAEASVAADAAVAAADIQNNPATGLSGDMFTTHANPGQARQGIAPAEASVLDGAPPKSFAADHAQRQDALPTEAPPQVARQAAQGIGGVGGEQAMRESLAQPEPAKKPEKPREPGVADQLDYLTKMAGLDLKYGKLSGEGMMQLVATRKQMADEGMRDALLQIHSGNAEAGVEAFNGVGKSRAKLVSYRPVVADLGGGVKLPTYEAILETPDGKRQTINAAQMLNGMRKIDGQISNAIQLLELQAKKQHDTASLAETRDYHQGMVDAAQARASGGGLTVPQQRTNEMIDAAREYVSGLSEAEIQKRTAQYSATGRENPDYNPMLSAKWKLANQRKYGPEDDGFPGKAAQPKADAQPAAPGQPHQPAPASQTPAPAPQKLKAGDVVDGYRFKGGNPNDPSAWEAQ